MRTEDFEKLGDQVKAYEAASTGRVFLPGIPVVARLDGRAFHTFCRGLNKPFDAALTETMQDVTKSLVEEFHADIGYTQSDKITLVFLKPEALFGGRVHKLESILASHATAVFTRNQVRFAGIQGTRVVTFDCRAFQVPDTATVMKVLTWREEDAIKNSIAALAQANFSHKALQGKNRREQLAMLTDKGIRWADLPEHLQRGSYWARHRVLKTLSPEELARIPAKHRPLGPVWRSEVREAAVPRMAQNLEIGVDFQVMIDAFEDLLPG